MKNLTAMRRRAVDRLLIQYLELPEHEQRDFLSRCGQRWPRLCRWLDRLVDGGHTVTLLDGSVRRLAEDSVERIETNAGALNEGDRLGAWEVTAEVGRGGMGRVYLGKRADGAFEMEVAIKQIGRRRRGLADLLQRECRLLARLDHPSVTRLVDAGLDDQAGPFLVMEWVDGTDLSDWLAQADPDLEPRLELFEQVTEAVAHAHQRLIVHGDIKPSNIRIRDDGTVKLMDFGVARLLASGERSEADVRALTPAFAAPEQMDGQEITPRSDIWSLGALLFWLLTGQHMPRCPDQAGELIARQRIAGSREMSAIVARACAEVPDERYANVGDLSGDLRNYLENRPLSVLPPTRRYRAGKFVRRNPALAAAGAGAILALVAGFGVSTVMYVQAEQARQQATIQQVQAETRALELEQVARFQESQLAEMDPQLMGVALRRGVIEQRRLALENGGASDQEVLEGLNSLETELAGVNFTDIALNTLEESLFDRTLAAIEERFSGQPLVRAQLLQSMASVLQELGHFQFAGTPQLKALSIRREHLGDQHPNTLSSAQALGALYWRQSRYEESGELIAHALENRRKTLGELHPDTLESIHGMGSLLITMERPEEGEYYLRTAVDGRREVLGANHEETLQSMVQLGQAIVNSGEPERAEPYVLKAVEETREYLGPDHSLTLVAMNNLGGLHTWMGRYEEAVEQHGELVKINSELYGAQHPTTLRSRSNLAHAMQGVGQLESAIEQHRLILEGRIRALGEVHADTWVSLLNLGATLRMTGEHEEAGRYLNRARSVADRVFGPYHLRTLITEGHVARLMLLNGEHEGAERTARQATDRAMEHLGMENLYTADLLYRHARILKAQQALNDAAERAQLAYEVAMQSVGPDHGLTRGIMEMLDDIAAQ